jgi:ribosomal protein L27
MGKKGGKSSGFISQGTHSNVRRSVLKAMRQDYIASGERIVNQRAAWAKGKNVVLTIENPNKNETNKRFIRVNARDLWGSPKYNR